MVQFFPSIILSHGGTFKIVKENDFKRDALNYLQSEGIILKFDIKTNLDNYVASAIDLQLDITKFNRFIPQIEENYKKITTPLDQKTINLKPLIDKLQARNAQTSNNNHPTPPISKETLYKITFPPSNEILLNDIAIIGKPNLDSENGNVFGYLMQNPNKKIKKKTIEESIGQSIGKDLHKIVENLGFKNDLRKAFFNVSKDVIFFRNPITKTDFEQLGIPPLRIPIK